MPRSRRYIRSGGVYEIVFRAREGIPLPCRQIIEILLKSAMARTQRDGKVVICHFVWMGNHVHMIVVVRDALMLTKFYGELQKRITDYTKALLGLEHLDLWEGRASVIYIGDLETAIDRIVYLYANPAKANLVGSIEEYPGYSSWKAYNSTNDTPLARYTERVPWFRVSNVPIAPSRELTMNQEIKLIRELSSKITCYHRIQLLPNAWMSSFGITTGQEVEAINKRIKEQLREREAKLDIARVQMKKSCIGVKKLKSQGLMRNHTPKNRTRRIFVISKIKEIRIAVINAVKAVSARCRSCYESWCKGDFDVKWPPGTFPPPIIPLANALAL